MKKTVLIGASLLALILFNSCNKKKEEVSPVAAQELYPSPSVKIGFSVHVLASSETARTEGLDGVNVTVKQNGNTYSATTDASGIATFGGLTEGTARWYIQKSGFASVNGVSTLTYVGTPVVDGTNGNTTVNGSVTVNNEQTSSTTAQVTISRLGASVSGTLLADLDGSGTGQTAVLGSGTIALKLANSFEPNIYTTTVSNGLYTFSNLPEGVAYSLETIDIVATNPAVGTSPSFKTNLNFPGGQVNGTTPSAGKTDQRGLVTLQ